MKRNTAISLALTVLVSSSLGTVTNTVRFGGGGHNTWSEGVVTNSAVSPTEYSVSYGVPARYSASAISNLSFTVTFTETNGIPVYSQSNWIFPSIDGAVEDRRLNSNEVLRLTTSYSDPDGKLMSLRLAEIGTTFNTLSHETMVFSDGVNSTSITDSVSLETSYDYEATGLDPLSTNNISTWELLVSVDDTLGGGTNFTEAGMGAFVLEYVADVDEIPAYVPLNPANFTFVNGTEFDAVGVGVSMTRSNNWDSPITITTVNIIGQDGSSATNGVDHKTNIFGSWNSLGINDAYVTGQEYGSFDPGEGWQVTFSEDVYLEEIDLASQAAGAELTLSVIDDPDFPVMVLEDGQSGDTHDLGSAIVKAGSVLYIDMTSPTNAADTTVRISYLEVQSVQDANSYDAWIQDQDLIEQLNDGYGDDPDLDGLDNLAEYAFGGTALSNDAALYGPTFELADDGGTNYMNYIYRRRLDRDLQGLTYAVGSSTNLASAAVTNATEEAGSIALDATYESVTNRVSTDAADAQFMQLKVTAD